MNADDPQPANAGAVKKSGRWRIFWRVLRRLALPLLGLYVGIYIGMSLNGKYVPAIIGSAGVKKWEWAPGGYLKPDSPFIAPDYRVFPVVFFFPLWKADHFLWHNYNPGFIRAGWDPPEG